jgi:heme a synthase
MIETLYPENQSLSPLVFIRRLLFTMAIATLFLMALGSATRVMNAGLSCPDWPLCYGKFVPTTEMNLQVFLEWFHRLIATGMGFLTIILTGTTWWFRKSLPKWLPILGGLALVLVLVQGALGALTVTELLRFDIVTSHLGTGLLFFTTLLSGAIALVPAKISGNSRNLAWAALTAAIVVYGQSILGGLVSSQWALHQCLAEYKQLCSVMNNHLIGVLPVSIIILIVVVLAWRSMNPVLRTLGCSVGVLLLLQVGIGIATYRLQLQVEPLTVAHQVVGATLLGTLVGLTVLAGRGDPNTRQISVTFKS